MKKAFYLLKLPMETEAYQKFLKNTLLPGITSLLKARQINEVPLKVQEISYEVFEILLKSFCAGLPKSFQKRFDLEDEEFLEGLREVINNLLSLPKEALEKRIVPLKLPQILAAWEQAKKIEEEIKEVGDKRRLSLERERYKGFWQQFLKRLEEALVEDFKDLKVGKEALITPKRAEKIVEEANPTLAWVLEETTRLKDWERTLPKVVAQVTSRFLAASNLKSPLADRQLKNLAEGLTSFSSKTKESTREIGSLQRKRQKERSKITKLIEHYMERARFAAYITLRLHPEFLETPQFREAFSEVTTFFFEKAYLLKNPKKLAEAVIKETAKRVGIERVADQPIETLVSLVVNQVPSDLLEKPVVPPLPSFGPPPSFVWQTEEKLRTSLKKNLEEFALGEDLINRVSAEALEVLAEEETAEKFSLLATEEKREQVEQIFTSLFEKEEVFFPKKREVLKRISQETLPLFSSFVSKQKESFFRIKEGLEKLQSPTLFFTTILPGPLKPVGFLLDSVGGIFPQTKEALLVGFFGGDKEKLKKTRKHYFALLRQTQREIILEENFWGETARLKRLKHKSLGFKNAYEVLLKMEKRIKKPTLSLRPFIALGDFLQKASSFIKKTSSHPLSLFAQIKKIDFRQFFPPFSTSFSVNLKKLGGTLLYQRFPRLFLKTPSGLPVFKFSLPGLKVITRDFWGKFKSFFRKKILNLPFFQGIKALGRRFLAGVGGRLFKSALFKIGSALLFKAASAVLSGGGALILEGGKLLFNFLRKGLPSFFGSLFGIRREKKVALGEDVIFAGGAVLAVIGVFFLALFFLFRIVFFAPYPYQLLQEKREVLGTMEKEVALPQATSSSSLQQNPQP